MEKKMVFARVLVEVSKFREDETTDIEVVQDDKVIIRIEDVRRNQITIFPFSVAKEIGL